MSHSQNCTICGLLQTLQCSDDPKLWIILWICSHACPCSRHEHWHTGDALVHFVGLLVSGCLTIGRRSFSWLRKVPGPVCVPSNPFSVQCFKKKNVFPVIGKSIKKLQVDGEGCLISLCFLLVLCVLWGDRSLCERGLCFVGFVGFFCHCGGRAQALWFLLTSDLVIFPFCRRPSLVDCTLKPPTQSLWQHTPPRVTELVAKLKSSPRLEQVRVGFIWVIM